MRGAFGQIIRNIIGGDGAERIPPTTSNRRRNEANRPIRQRRRRQDIHDDVPEPQMEEDVSLVFLYDNMGDGAVHDTRQLGGYMTLLQRWIYEHFPRICKRGDRGAVPAHLPRACRWIAKHAVEGGLVTYRQRLDALLLEDVVFTPYDDDRANHRFEDISMFSGYLRCGGVSDYYPWYMSVSHPLIIHRSTAHAGTSSDHPSDHPSAHPSSAAHVGTSSAAHTGPSSFDRDRRAAELVHRAINLVEPFSEIHEILSELSLLYDD
uniref:Uncharacterized protein LOC101509732 n=1 Tax=Cicer arietinum TaxID=3827 RepID=A0A1S2Y5X4_CICAR|nr:uncharacterized protein LOC101509732 [Cicer arietinum]